METISHPPANLFQALADPSRLLVVQTLSAGPRRAGELAERSKLSPPTMSKHLKVLLDAGIIVDRRDATDARVRQFELRVDQIRSLAAWCDGLQAEWNTQLNAFKRHVEKR